MKIFRDDNGDYLAYVDLVKFDGQEISIQFRKDEADLSEDAPIARFKNVLRVLTEKGLGEEMISGKDSQGKKKT